jgi:hypothetical protein
MLCWREVVVERTKVLEGLMSTFCRTSDRRSVGLEAQKSLS